jgi:hypothetical protein
MDETIRVFLLMRRLTTRYTTRVVQNAISEVDPMPMTDFRLVP